MGVLREPGWPLGRYIQSTLESQAGTPERALIEKASNESDAVGHPKAVGLNEIHRGQEAGLTKQVGPCIGKLHLEFFEAATEREFLKSGGAFGKQNQAEGVIGPIGKRNFERNHTGLSDGSKSRAIDIGS